MGIGESSISGLSEMPEQGARFNMAMDTLKRVADVLREITILSKSTEFSLETKQNLMLQLVKQFYINSSPLLKPEVSEKFLFVLDIQPLKRKVYSKTNSGSTVAQGYSLAYDPAFESTLFKIVIKIQTELQKDKYFMPDKNDPRFALAQD